MCFDDNQFQFSCCTGFRRHVHWTSQFYHISNNDRQLEIPISPPPFYGHRYRQPPCPASLRLSQSLTSLVAGGIWQIPGEWLQSTWFFGCRTSWIFHRITRTVKTLNRFLHGEGEPQPGHPYLQEVGISMPGSWGGHIPMSTMYTY